MQPLHVTLLYGGISALVVTGLGVYVSLLRLYTRTWMGMDLPKVLVRPVRVHGNAAEWVPLSILLLALLELSGLSSTMLHVLGGSIVAVRLIHMAGAFGKKRVVSITAATLNYILLATLAGWAVLLHFAEASAHAIR